MIITYFRSSSLSTFKICPQKGFINYVLNKPHRSNLAAAKGSVVHKIMELLALGKLAIQNGKTEFDAEELGIIQVADIDDIEYLHSLAVPLIQSECPYLLDPKEVSARQLWTDEATEECLQWTLDALSWCDGLYDPRNQKIVAVEKHFDFPIKEKWAKYSYDLGGEKIEGYLNLRGTVDLIVEDAPGVLMVIDYKTGAPSKTGGIMDWSTYKDKSYDDVKNDLQFRLYHYVLALMYPEYEHIFLTAFYTRSGGPRILDYTREDGIKTQQILRQRFEEIKAIQIPDVSPGKKCNFCDYRKISVELGMSPCEFYQQEVLAKGMNQVILEHGEDRSFSAYTGGGRTINKTGE